MTSIFKERGFTLIEIMVVVVIVAILSAIAIPQYQDYVIRAKIMPAISELSARQVKMEQCFQDNHSYSSCGACSTGSIENFAFTCTSTATTFTLTATGSNQMAGFVYTVDHNNVRVTTSVPAGWTGSSSCWITKKGGVC
jgi:type IV pilus assembly protein PilE